MRASLLPLLAGALPLAACATAPAEELAAVTVSVPTDPLAGSGAQVLAWSREQRSAAFRAMEDHFPGLEVAPARTPRALPAGEPLPAAAVAALDAYLAGGDVAGIVVLQDGRTRYERYALGFAPEQRWTSFSVAKSFTSTLLGAALADGSISGLDDLVTRYIPALAGSAYDGVSVEQLATMRSGVRWNEDYTDPQSDVARMFDTPPAPGQDQVVEYMRRLPRASPPGENWVYNTGETNLLGVLVENATGETLAAYAKRKIVDPAGFAHPLFWQTDLSDRSVGGCCLSAALTDYARLGQFVLDGGAGVVPAGWFARAGAAQVDLGDGFGYGYQWWTYPGAAFGAQGIFGQSITLMPERRMVIAIVGNWPRATGPQLSAARRAVWQAVATAR